ncbi:PREDICTED: uncharacterized protein LOC108374433 [Rhagoletis zephyria]|uniref:uncharacterized protein LOC108374433 n=1 Tax=Rhagoletis zephyria TaxID=28612 RepID=UPI0008117C65|nr:PREDICTED: uncharacterized protein LOC108374433 [Rhagoletis zephyria]
MATILDPRFKKEAFISENIANETSNLLENEIMHFMGHSHTQPPSQQETTEGEDTLFSFLHEKNRNKRRSKRADLILIKHQYLERQNAAQNTNPLDYWKLAEEDFLPLKECGQK